MQLRAFALNHCVYCLAMHRRDAKKDGWGEEKISSTERWTDYKEQFSDEECAALELTDAVTRIHGEESVPDELRNRIGITTRLDPRSLSGVDDFDLGIRA
ncbi:carboxymuconolactone decarboxylase family protein [Corynebacterium sp. Marseille-P8863]|uniref:carboxymuconolactone decarboxylase family protein n=1 Tax=Corynebacterium sp. Marseille-P8863 TaxID=2866576 RepID=UPI002263CF76|nr:carboxymuconolactone decarboxylase family protein [Corynebacterium sp. Marseille-P8863]